jgi:hypothetical protein
MAIKKYRPEEIVVRLPQVEVLMGQWRLQRSMLG